MIRKAEVELMHLEAKEVKGCQQLPETRKSSGNILSKNLAGALI